MPDAGRLKLEPMNEEIRSFSLPFDDYPIGILNTIFSRCVYSVAKHGGLAECVGEIEL